MSEYNQHMADPTAAVMVLDHIPDEEEVEELAYMHLDDYPAEEATARVEIVYEPPTWLNISEQDQMSAHLRDGGVCILVVYMTEGEPSDDD